jgi:hypothetical protein
MYPESKPIIPPQPNRPQYGVSDLALFELFQTREDYTAKFGVAPPQFDEREKPKYWFDSTVDAEGDPEGQVDYTVIRNGAITPSRITMSNWEASRVNIPDSVQEGAAAVGPFVKKPWLQPVRNLLPGETLFVGFGGVTSVMRADLVVERDAEAQLFLPSDRALLKDTHTLAQRIAKALNI